MVALKRASPQEHTNHQPQKEQHKIGDYAVFKILFTCLSPVTVIPQTCRYRGARYACGLSISCVLGGGKPLDLCSGGMIWACCVDRDTTEKPSEIAPVVHNASKLTHSKFPLILNSRDWQFYYLQHLTGWFLLLHKWPNSRARSRSHYRQAIFYSLSWK